MQRVFLLPCVLALLLSGRLLAQISFDPEAQQLTSPPSNTPPEQRCVVQGRVTNSQTGEPLKKVLLRLTRVGGNAPGTVGAIHAAGAQGYAGSSEADGSFRFEGIEPGEYTLFAERTGYLETHYGARNPRAPGKILTLTPAQQLSELNVALTRQAVIAGKVLDEDGDPTPDVTVQVLTTRWIRGKLRYMPSGGSSTNDLGEFRIGHLGPGKYYLFAEQQGGWAMREPQAPATPGKPDTRPVRTFYPDAVTRASATPIEIRPGQDALGMDIRLHTAATYHVRGKIAGALPEGESDHLAISLTQRDEEAMFFFGGQSNIQKDLTFDVPGMAPGAYTLTIFKMGGPIRPLARLPVDIGAADLNGLAVNIVPPVSLHGQVRLEATPSVNNPPVNVSNVRVSLSPMDRGAFFGGMESGQVKPDGSFTIENVSPGKYFVRASRPGNGTYLKAIRFGQEDVLGKELDLSQGSSGELDILFRSGSAEVDGTVNTPAANTPANFQDVVPQTTAVSIILVPEVLDPDGSGIRQSSTDGSGAFSMKQIPPGRYRAYAFEQVQSEEVQNPDLLRQLQSKGVEVELRENDKKQIQLPLISAEDYQQILARLGIDPQ